MAQSRHPDRAGECRLLSAAKALILSQRVCEGVAHLCQLLALNGNAQRAAECLLSGVKRTSQFDRAKSAVDPTQTLKSVSHYLRIAALMLH
jgi:hypothetical protein